MPDKSIQIAEKKINDILFWLCLFVTLLAMGMMLVEFFTRGKFPPTRIGTFYMGVLLIYSIHKEALRWLEDRGLKQEKRNGEYLVYAWIVITAVLYLTNFLTKGYFTYSSEGINLAALPEITFTTLEVCGVFIVTRVFKILTLRFFKKSV